MAGEINGIGNGNRYDSKQESYKRKFDANERVKAYNSYKKNPGVDGKVETYKNNTKKELLPLVSQSAIDKAKTKSNYSDFGTGLIDYSQLGVTINRPSQLNGLAKALRLNKIFSDDILYGALPPNVSISDHYAKFTPEEKELCMKTVYEISLNDSNGTLKKIQDTFGMA